jgi:hypothetical protein
VIFLSFVEIYDILLKTMRFASETLNNFCVNHFRLWVVTVKSVQVLLIGVTYAHIPRWLRCRICLKRAATQVVGMRRESQKKIN